MKPTDTPREPRVSIALCTCNGERFVEPLLASLARQTGPPEELVIGDDASDDGTLAILDHFAQSAPFPVRIVPRSERWGHVLAPLRRDAGPLRGHSRMPDETRRIELEHNRLARADAPPQDVLPFEGWSTEDVGG